MAPPNPVESRDFRRLLCRLFVSAATGLRTLRLVDFAAISALAIFPVLLFRKILAHGWTFIGDSDRLNTFLNIRLFETDWIRASGRVPGWDEGQFAGQSMAGLHYMVPGAGLIAYLEAFFPRPMLFEVMGYASLALLACAAWAAYAFIKDSCRDALASFAGAAVYSMSVYSLHRLSQLDASFAVLIYLPLAMLLVRRAQRSNLIWTFWCLLALNSMAVGLFFLQEVAYVALLLSGYALFRSFSRRTVVPAASFGFAMAIAVVIAAPRLLDVAENFRLIARSLGFPGTSWGEIFRFFDEGIFGRYWGEPQRYGNSFGLNEGLQLISTSFGSFLVLWFAATRKRLSEQIAAIFLFAIVSLVVLSPLSMFYTRVAAHIPYLQVETVAIVINAIALAMAALVIRGWIVGRHNNRSRAQSLGATDPTEPDIVFHIAMIAAVLALVVIRDIQYLLHLAFMKADFTHARISIVALLPLSTLVAFAVHRLRGKHANLPSVHHSLSMICIGAVAALFVWLLRGPLIQEWFSNYSPIRMTANFLAPVHEVVRTLLAGVLLGAVLVAFAKARSPEMPRRCATLIAFLVAFESFAYSDFKFFGPNAQAPSRPFEHGYMLVPPGVLNPPTTQAVMALSRRLETESYRSVLIPDPAVFSAYVAPHLAAFWRLRLVDGYGAGVPARLAGLPWPSETYAGRALSFRSATDVPWGLLALLNVKYAVIVNTSLYYNVAEPERPGMGPADPTHVDILSNPYFVTPRIFFAQSAVPGASAVTKAMRAADSLNAIRKRQDSAMAKPDTAS